MQTHEQGAGRKASGQADAGEALTVHEMPVTEAAELPPAAYDLSDYKPVHEPVSLYRRFGRGAAAPPVAGDEVRPTPDEEDFTFAEGLRRQLANHGHPPDVVLQVRCAGRDRHPLLWLVKSPWGLVPITRTSDEPEDDDDGIALTSLPTGGEPVTREAGPPRARRFTSHFHGEDLNPGRPRTLREWPEDRPLPPASCPCHAEVVLTLTEVKRWLSSARRSVTYRRSAPTI